jgi:HlyD family secretion protein
MADRDLASEEERDEAEATYKAELAQVEADKAALAFAEQALGDAELYAPADGVIRERILEPGDMASPLTPVFTLALMDPVWVRAYLPETALGRVRLGAIASITTDSFPGKVYKGWIGYIAPTAEFTPKNVETTELRARLVYRMRVYACNPVGELRLGMPATVRLDLTATDKPGPAVCDDG